MPISSFAINSLIVGTLLLGGCQSSTEAPVAADLNSANPAVAEQARKVQELTTQIERQKAVIETEKTKLTALQQQLEGSQQNLDGLKKEMQATP
jgi:septal ring factor EnvC (AmiA/AmiB activator)